MDWYLNQKEGKKYFNKDHTYVINFDTNRWCETDKSFDWEWYEGVHAISNRRMTYLNGIVTKYFPKEAWNYEEKIKILNTIHPNYIIDYVRKGGCEYYTYKYINGYSGKHYIQNNEGSDYVKWTISNFFKNTYQELLPYAKMTYQLSDVVADNDNISLIDWEDVYKPTEEERQKDLIKINKLFEFNRRVSVGGSYEYWNGTIQFQEL
tara:strand:+ start:311 stop:931 length:621 start_codon:yes stop_codon:yes gene_type:complete